MIEIPAMGVIFLPLMAWLFWIRSPWLYHLVPLTAWGQGGACVIVQFGGLYMGFQPAYLAAFLGLVRFSLDLKDHAASGAFAREPQAKYLPWMLLACWAVLTAVTLPFLLAGEFRVQTGRDGFLGEGNFRPNRFSSTNISQPVYLAAFASWSFCYCCIGRAMGERFWRQFRAAMAIGTGIALFAGYAQWVGRTLRFDVTSWFFNSNYVYSQLGDHKMGNYYRMAGSFTEASAAAYYFTATCIFYGAAAIREARRLELALFVGSVLALMLTQSSTGFAGLMMASALLGWRFLADGPRPGQVAGLAVMAAMATFVLWATGQFDGLLRLVEDAYDRHVINKHQSASFEMRTGADLRGVELFVESLGLGIGWGSHRPSSFAAMILSNGGVLGVVLFLWGVRNSLVGANLMGWVGLGSRYAIIALLALHCVSTPELTSMIWWVLLAVGMSSGMHPSDAAVRQDAVEGRMVASTRSYRLLGGDG